MIEAALSDPATWRLTPDVARPIREKVDSIGARAAFFLLGDPFDPNSVVANSLDMAPGHVIERHSHDCYRLMAVLRGTLDDSGETRVAGHISVSGPMEMYGPYVAGPEGCTTLICYSTIRGLGEIFHESETGVNRVRFLEDKFLDQARTYAQDPPA